MNHQNDKTTASDPLLCSHQIAALLGISKRTLERLRSSGEFPAPDLRLGPRILRWRSSTVRAWLEAQSSKQVRRRAS